MLYFIFSERFERFQGRMNSDRSNSPSSESGASSSRSDWFRQSVLFWSSQSERSDRSNSFMEDDTFVAAKSKKVNGLCCDSPPPGRNEYDDSSSGEDSNKPARNILEEFDASDLLKQVDELERCFKKSRTELIISEEAAAVQPGSSASPHLTLEFPKGSSIRENPIFKGDLLLRKQNSRAQSVNEIREDEVLVIQQPNKQNRSDEDEDEVAKGSDDGEEEDEKHILESIQKVQTTLCEISREIELSSACSRLSNLQCSDDEDDGNVVDIEKCTVEDSGEQSDANEGRDPNLVMRDWLSNIKPPPSQHNTQTHTKQLSADYLAQHKADIASETTVEIPTIEASQSRPPTREELFKKIDELMDFHRDDDDPGNKTALSHRSNSVKSSNRDRLDSGLQSVSSDSSPYPSPNVTRALHQQQRDYPATSSKVNSAIRGKVHEGTDHVFRDDSDFSDWSPISTLESHRGGTGSAVSGSVKRGRSQSVSYSPRTRREIRNNNWNSMSNVPKEISKSHEAATIEKFLQLTNKYLDKDGASSLNATISIDDVSFVCLSYR